VRLLLDSHAYLWWLADDQRLGVKARRAITDPTNTVLVSSATIWEIAIKAALGRLDLHGADVVSEIAANRFVELPITAAHAAAAAALPHHHDDPFDRMLIAQAQIEHLRCVTRDEAFSAYRVPTLW
jgi:PIN domain nuclease of toxin-antitoxin system